MISCIFVEGQVSPFQVMAESVQYGVDSFINWFNKSIPVQQIVSINPPPELFRNLTAEIKINDTYGSVRELVWEYSFMFRNVGNCEINNVTILLSLYNFNTNQWDSIYNVYNRTTIGAAEFQCIDKEFNITSEYMNNKSIRFNVITDFSDPNVGCSGIGGGTITCDDFSASGFSNTGLYAIHNKLRYDANVVCNPNVGCLNGTACSIYDNRTCSEVGDLNYCIGPKPTNSTSEFTSCNYCNMNVNYNAWNTCSNNQQNRTYSDTNWASCCQLTYNKATGDCLLNDTASQSFTYYQFQNCTSPGGGGGGGSPGPITISPICPGGSCVCSGPDCYYEPPTEDIPPEELLPTIIINKTNSFEFDKYRWYITRGIPFTILDDIKAKNNINHTVRLSFKIDSELTSAGTTGWVKFKFGDKYYSQIAAVNLPKAKLFSLYKYIPVEITVPKETVKQKYVVAYIIKDQYGFERTLTFAINGGDDTIWNKIWYWLNTYLINYKTQYCTDSAITWNGETCPSTKIQEIIIKVTYLQSIIGSLILIFGVRLWIKRK